MIKQVTQIENVERDLFFTKINQIRKEIAEVNKNLQQNPTEKLLTTQQTAEYFNVSTVTVWHWTNKGLLTAYKIANRKYYKLSEIENALTEIKA